MLPRIYLLLALSLVFCAATSSAQGSTEAGVLTFQEFSRRVSAYYPKLKAANSDVDMALAQQMQARAGFWPTISLSAGYRVTDDPVNVFGMLLRQERFSSSDFDLKRLNTPARHQDLDAGVHLELPLFDAMQTIRRMRSSRDNLKSAQAEQVFTQMEALLMAYDAYINALVLQNNALIIEAVQKDSGRDLKKAGDLKDKGMILGADYYLARVTFGEFTRMKNELTRQLKAMNTLLNILMGNRLDQGWVLTGVTKVKVFPELEGRQLLETALANRPDITAYTFRLQASDSELKRERSAWFPHLSAFADATNDRDRFTQSGGNNYAVGVKAQMMLFDPEHEGRVRAARALHEKIASEEHSLRDVISADITRELSRYDTLRDNMAVLEGMTEDAKEGVSLMLPLYSEGRKSITDLLEGRRAYLSSAQAFNSAMMGIWTSESRLLFLTGTLNNEAMRKIAEGAGL